MKLRETIAPRVMSPGWWYSWSGGFGSQTLHVPMWALHAVCRNNNRSRTIWITILYTNLFCSGEDSVQCNVSVSIQADPGLWLAPQALFSPPLGVFMSFTDTYYFPKLPRYSISNWTNYKPLIIQGKGSQQFKVVILYWIVEQNTFVTSGQKVFSST